MDRELTARHHRQLTMRLRLAKLPPSALAEAIDFRHPRSQRSRKKLSGLRARADGSYRKRLAALARTDLLLLNDWGLAPFDPDRVRDLLEILDDRYDRKSTLIVSQVPVDAWHQSLGDPTLADASLDRLVPNFHRLELAGDSMRKTSATHHSAIPPVRHFSTLP